MIDRAGDSDAVGPSGPAASMRGGDPRRAGPRGARDGGAPGAGGGRDLVELRPAREKKAFVRAPPDRTQRWRRRFQIAFLLLNVAIGVQFWVFVRFHESGGRGLYLPRPPGVEGWLPIAALMNLKAASITGALPERLAAGMFLFVAFLAITLVFRKAFCSWLCPIGTISEWLWRLGRRLFRRNFALPAWLDGPLRSLKYVLLALFGWAVAGMSVEAIRAFLASPYGLVADVKMLDFFRHMGPAALAVVALLVAASVLVQNFWCRYLCPYGALHGLVSWFSPVRIRRSPDTCIDCAKCAKACPSRLPVDVKISVWSPECTGCLECVAACPVKDTLALTAPRNRRVPLWTVAAGIAALFLGIVAYARRTGHWETPVDPRIHRELILRASELAHPR